MQNNTDTNTAASLSALRDHMANERTFLAWTRTSIGIMAFGFVVEKFSLFLKQITFLLGKYNPTEQALSPPSPQPGYSAIFGIVLVALGALIALLAFFKYKKVEMQINKNTFKPTSLLDAMLTLTIVGIGLFLTVYLIKNLG